MDYTKTFKTKTGFCHVEKDNIILTRDGIIGNISKITTNNKISRILIIYSGLSFFLLYNASKAYKTGERMFSLYFVLLAIFLIYGILKSWNNSATPIIERNRIKDVKFINAKSGLTRSRFEILFEDTNGKLKKRLIMLPGSLSDGRIETDKALEIMKKEGFIKS
jgi:hypothetical protein